MFDIGEDEGKVYRSTSPMRVDTVSNDSTVSSSYSNLVIDVGGEIITVRGSKRTEKVTSLLRILETGRYSCQVYGEESQDRTNIVVHIGFIHDAPPYESCRNKCFDTCTTNTNKNSPTSTQFPPLIISNFVRFHGEFHPKEAVDPALDYSVDFREGKPAGKWVCAMWQTRMWELLCYILGMNTPMTPRQSTEDVTRSM